MELTVTEAATLLGRSRRTVRAQLVRGELKGRKRGGQWRIRKADLPETAAEIAESQDRVGALRDALEDGIPRAVKKKIGAIPLHDLDVFALGRSVLFEMRAAELDGLADARASLADALRALAAGHHRFDRDAKLEALRRARDGVSETITRLLLLDGATDTIAPWVVRLEAEALPRLAGLIRWAERLKPRREAA